MSTVKTKINPEIVLAHLQKNFDDSITDIVFINGGEMSQAFSFESQKGKFVIRINTSSRSFYKDKYAYEHFASPQIPIPEIIQIDQLDDTYHFAISKKVEGKHINDLTTEEYMKTLPSLLSILNAIHAQDIAGTTGYGKWNAEGNAESKTWQESILSVKNYPETENLFETSFLEKDVWDKFYGEMKRLSKFCPEERFLLHGDYSHNNVMSDGEKVTGVFDWDGSAYGDPVFDVAWMAFWMKQEDRIQATEDFYRKRNIPYFEERLLCYKLRIGLSSMSFFAFSQQRDKYDFVKKLIFSLSSTLV